MPYDANGNYDPTLQKDAEGFYNRVSTGISTNPYANGYDGMNHVKAAALIQKQVG